MSASTPSTRVDATPTSSAEETQRLQAAAAWHARMEGGAAAAEDWSTFTEWLADARNRTAFDAVDAAANEAVEILSLNRELAVTTSPPPGLMRAFSTRAFLGMAGIAAAVLIAVAARPDLFKPTTPDLIATAAGERRDVTLADGSTVHLNTNTTLAVAMNATARTVRLERGEALFDVVPDTAHPFHVAVGDRTVRVVGTAFNVLRHEGRIAVTVAHGNVDVAGGDANDAVRLAPGDQYAAREGAQTYTIAKTDPAVVTAWRDGRVVFMDTPLSDVASELSRYYARPVVIQDPAVAVLRFSGILKIEEQMATVRRLEAFLPITVKQSGDEVTLEQGTSR